MRSSTRRLALTASAVLALAAGGGFAMAQTPPPMNMAPAGHEAMPMMRHGMAGDPAAHAQHLRDVLQLRPDQDAALKAYLDAADPHAMMASMKPDGMGGDMGGDGDEADKPMTTPERLDRQAAHMAGMAAAFQKQAAATKAFYAALSPSQQKAFDALGPEMGGPRMKMMMMRGPGHHGMPMGEHKDERTVIMKRKPG
ncbi:MAG: Spy/CpxP family protein refolding chaperone [Alphaproteobacteria bacterium]|nr:Spy/CpxP family protein refolding chaperone [Alphaproteobacteria bacterium]